MKKILFALLISLCLLPGVKADSIYDLTETQKYIHENAYIKWLDFNGSTHYCSSYSSCYEKALTLFNDSNNQYYFISIVFTVKLNKSLN